MLFMTVDYRKASDQLGIICLSYAFLAPIVVICYLIYTKMPALIDNLDTKIILAIVLSVIAFSIISAIISLKKLKRRFARGNSRQREYEDFVRREEQKRRDEWYQEQEEQEQYDEERYERQSKDYGGDNPFEVLGVDENSSENKVKNVYRELSKKWHPDTYPTDDPRVKELATEKFVKIQQAYEQIKQIKGWK